MLSHLWKVKEIMAKKRSSDAYRKLVRFMIVFFVLAVLCGAGYMLLDQSIKAQEAENAARAKEENDQLTAQYQQAKREEAAQQEKVVEDVRWPEAKKEGWDVIDLSAFPLENAATAAVSRQDLLLGGMVLVNRWHAVPGDMPIDQLVGVHATDRTIPTSSSSVKLYPAAVTALGKMLAAAKEAGLEHYNVEEGFRAAETQQAMYDKMAAKYSGSYTGDNLINKVFSEGVSYPGTSEYESGFAFNMDRYVKKGSEGDEIMDHKFYELPQSDWLVEHSWEYGVILRFPIQGYPNSTVTDKAYKTGQGLKLNIYRYVGEAHAAVMHALDLCMEEYIEYLMAHPHIAVYENGTLRYEITRVQADDAASSVTVSYSRKAREYTASFDNVGGVIVAMAY